MNKIKAQTSKALWLDAEGNEVPKARVFKHEKIVETSVVKIANKALFIEDKLNELIDIVEAEFEKIMKSSTDFLAEPYDLRKSITVYLFDKSVRAERQVQRIIDFDIRLLEESYELFLKYLSGEETSPLVSKLIQQAFKNSKGTWDRNKISKLLPYEFDDTISSETFKDAVRLLKQARVDGEFKAYYKISILDGEEYRPVKLNLPYKNFKID